MFTKSQIPISQQPLERYLTQTNINKARSCSTVWLGNHNIKPQTIIMTLLLIWAAAVGTFHCHYIRSDLIYYLTCFCLNTLCTSCLQFILISGGDGIMYAPNGTNKSRIWVEDFMIEMISQICLHTRFTKIKKNENDTHLQNLPNHHKINGCMVTKAYATFSVTDSRPLIGE